jgi:hypothetical protein
VTTIAANMMPQAFQSRTLDAYGSVGSSTSFDVLMLI